MRLCRVCGQPPGITGEDHAHGASGRAQQAGEHQCVAAIVARAANDQDGPAILADQLGGKLGGRFAGALHERWFGAVEKCRFDPADFIDTVDRPRSCKHGVLPGLRRRRFYSCGALADEALAAARLLATGTKSSAPHG